MSGNPDRAVEETEDDDTVGRLLDALEDDLAGITAPAPVPFGGRLKPRRHP